ncbi:hypothetical protein Tco_0940198 [Tanacetum coccineum]|uniref:Uncharacterized protein n=1 Tax=Tanacetum coccineum TaxID=301880 RepID=A0ABQ5DPW7_9ASTR
MDGTILYLVQCESLCRILVFPPLTGCDRLVIRAKVMSTPAYVDSETITQADRAQSSREAPSEAEESQPLGSRVPLMSEEFEASELSGTRTISSHSSASSDFTAPTARMTVRAHPSMSLGYSARVAEAMTLSDSAFHKRYRSSNETPSPSPSPILLVWKRYRGTSELILDTDSERDELGDENTEEDREDESSDSDDEREGRGLDDEGQGLEDEGPYIEEEEKAIPEGQQQAVPAADTAMGEPLGLGYGALRRLPSPIASPVATPEATISVDEDQFLEVGALELHVSILHDHTQRLDALPPTLFEGYDRDLRELYTRSRAVRDEIFSQRYRFRSLEREQERATVTFSVVWRPVLALETWAGQTDAQRAALWHAIYDIQRENHDLRRQITEERRERLELTNHVTRMERR